MNFELHKRLTQNCLELGQFELCRLLLMNDSQFPWYILVPEVPAISELHQLNNEQRYRLLEESCYLAQQLSEIYHADKMNIASLGNLVPQLHIHHVVRYRRDKAWPGPVWGAFDSIPYTAQEIEKQFRLLKSTLTRCRFN